MSEVISRKEKIEKLREMTAALAAMSIEDRTQLIDTKIGSLITCDGHALSVKNACLLIIQLKNATCVGGFKQWQKHNRKVMKDDLDSIGIQKRW